MKKVLEITIIGGLLIAIFALPFIFRERDRKLGLACERAFRSDFPEHKDKDVSCSWIKKECFCGFESCEIIEDGWRRGTEGGAIEVCEPTFLEFRIKL